jgi:hypothetical protein
MDDRTKEILNRFNTSWDETEERYEDLINSHEGFERLKPILHFIKKLRSNGENSHFRIGTAMHALMFSRSVNFGLRDDQKSLSIEAMFGGGYEVIFKEGSKIYRQYNMNTFVEETIMKLLATLKRTLID